MKCPACTNDSDVGIMDSCPQCGWKMYRHQGAQIKVGGKFVSSDPKCPLCAAANAELSRLRSLESRLTELGIAKVLYGRSPEYKWNGTVALAWHEVSQWTRNGFIEDAKVLLRYLRGEG